MAQFGRPASDDLNEWTATNAFDQINEVTADDNTFVASPWAPAGEILRVKFSSLVDPQVGDGHTIRYRLKLGRAAAGVTFAVRVVDENQFRYAEWEHTADLTTSWQGFSQTLTADEANQIDNYAELYVEFVATQDDTTPPPSNDRGLQVSHVTLVTPDAPAGSTDRGLQVSYVDFTISDDLVGQGVHPRALITPETLASVRTTLCSTWNAEMAAFINALDADYAAITGLVNNQINAEYWRAMMSYAFAAQMDPANPIWVTNGLTWGRTQAEYRTKALALFDALRAGVATAKDWTLPAMLAYDWMAEWLTEDEKNTIVAFFYAQMRKTPQAEDNPFDDQPAGNRSSYVMSGMVTYGDCTAVGQANEGNAAAITRYGRATEVLYGSGTSTMDAADFMAGTTGGWSQGLEYCDKPNYYAMWIVTEAFRTALGLDKDTFWLAKSGVRYYPRWITALILPYESPAIRYLHRAWYGSKDMALGQGTNNVFLYGVASLYASSDPLMANLAQWLIEAGRSETHNNSYYQKWFLVSDVLGFGSKPTAVASPTDAGMALVENFQPLGHLVARTHFGSAWHSVLDSHLSWWAANYSRQGTYWPPTQGDVTLERRGAPVLIHRGVNTHHPFNSGESSGNTLIFVPDILTYTGTANGGTRKTAGKHKNYLTQLVRGGELDVGGIRRLSSAGDVIASRADLTRSYNSTSIADTGEYVGIARYTRTIVWFRPAASGDADVLVVCDRYTLTDTTVEPRSLWQPSMAVNVTPTIGGTEAAYTRNGNSTGYLQYTGANAASVSWPLINNGAAYLTHVYDGVGLARTVRVGGPNSDGVWNWPTANAQNFKIASLTASGGTATCTLVRDHNFLTGDEITIGGTLSPKALNVCAPITVTATNAFTYPCHASLSATATGTGDWIATKASHEFDRAFGCSYVNDPGENPYTDAEIPRVGRYRVEFLPDHSGGTLSNTLVHVVEAVDNGVAQSTTAAYSGGSTHVAVRVGTRVVAFAKVGAIDYTAQIGTATTPGDENSVGGTVAFRIDAVGSWTVTICDLDVNTDYNVAVSGGGTPSSSNESADSGGVLTLSITTAANPTTVTLTRL